MLGGMTATHLAEWQAFFSICPWGEERADMRTAIIAAVNANAWDSKRHKVTEFLAHRPPKPKQDIAAQLEATWAGLQSMKERQESHVSDR